MLWVRHLPTNCWKLILQKCQAIKAKLGKEKKLRKNWHFRPKFGCVVTFWGVKIQGMTVWRKEYKKMVTNEGTIFKKKEKMMIYYIITWNQSSNPLPCILNRGCSITRVSLWYVLAEYTVMVCPREYTVMVCTRRVYRYGMYSPSIPLWYVLASIPLWYVPASISPCRVLA